LVSEVSSTSRSEGEVDDDVAWLVTRESFVVVSQVLVTDTEGVSVSWLHALEDDMGVSWPWKLSVGVCMGVLPSTELVTRMHGVLRSDWRFCRRVVMKAGEADDGVLARLPCRAAARVELPKAAKVELLVKF
jgi:hypothetical protein